VVAKEVVNITRWNNLTREKARKLGIEGFWELHQMEKKETNNINDLLKKQENKEKDQD
jgi:hypothetical protein